MVEIYLLLHQIDRVASLSVDSVRINERSVQIVQQLVVDLRLVNVCGASNRELQNENRYEEERILRKKVQIGYRYHLGWLMVHLTQHSNVCCSLHMPQQPTTDVKTASTPAESRP